jgi:hypothetical protein
VYINREVGCTMFPYGIPSNQSTSTDRYNMLTSVERDNTVNIFVISTFGKCSIFLRYTYQNNVKSSSTVAQEIHFIYGVMAWCFLPINNVCNGPSYLV